MNNELVEIQMGEIPLVVVDVGASGGLCEPFRGRPGITAVLFEPDQRAPLPEVTADAARCIIIPSALADREGERDFYLVADQECSSCLPPNTAFLARFPNPERFSVVRKIRINATTLDRALDKAGILPDFIKVDVQGFEHNILTGASRSLGSAGGLALEVEFEPLYAGQTLFPEIHELMRERGFELFDLQRSFWKRKLVGDPDARGQLLFANALYLRPPENIEGWASGSREKLLKMWRLYDLFGYRDCMAVVPGMPELPRGPESPAAVFWRRKAHGALWRLEQWIKRLRKAVLWKETFNSCDREFGNTRGT